MLTVPIALTSRGVHRLIPRRADEALRGEVVDLVGLVPGEDAENRAHVGDVAVRDLDAIEHAEFAQPPHRVAAAARCQSDDAVLLGEQKLSRDTRRPDR